VIGGVSEEHICSAVVKHIRPTNWRGDTFSTGLHTLVIWCPLHVMCIEDKQQVNTRERNIRRSSNIAGIPQK
jgi:hypothetical protein